MGTSDARKELIPIEKLKAYLIWREKEFVEKYEGVGHNTEEDAYSSFEATFKNGNMMVAVMNTTLLKWDSIASHPWIACIEIENNGQDSKGMPDKMEINLMNEFEDKLSEQLKDADGYLYIGRKTGDNERIIYFACKEFRKLSKVIDTVMEKYKDKWKIAYSIYKDKYWQTFEKFK